MLRNTALLTLIGLLSHNLALADDLAKDFASPPDAARPGVWWRWIDGNISKEGITRDLREMSRQGIRRLDLFDVAGAPQVGPVAMMGPKWREMFGHAIREAAAARIRVGVVPAAGWGMGGPWIDPAHAAKMLKHSEIQVHGPRHVSQILPRPSGSEPYYHDIALVAFPERPNRPVQPAAIAASSAVQGYCAEENWPPADVADGDLTTCWKAGAPASESRPAWIELSFHEPLTARSLFIAGAKDGGPKDCELQSTDDGKTSRTITLFTLERGEARRVQFPAATALKFRLLIKSAHVPDVQLAEVWLLRDGDEPCLRPGIQWWWFKSGQRSFWDWPKKGPAVMDEEYPEDGVFDCRSSEVIDLSTRLGAAGKLEWDAPPGRWTIARFGAVLGGEGPRMASRAVSGGYEPDPYSPASADVMFEHTVKPMLSDAGSEAGKTLKDVFVDSWEYGATAAGFQPTWTDQFREAFKKQRGYDLITWLPALARRVVDSRPLTDRFFWDYRQTLGELYCDFYARLTALSHQHGLQTRAENGYGTYPFQHIEGLAAFARVDVPMGEFWFKDPVMSQSYHFADSVRTAASAAHIYGRRFAAAESLTIGHGIWEAPGEFKTCLDSAFCSGLNQSMLHMYSHQYDITARPGLDTYDLLNANMTWWEQSHAFLDYIARCQVLLQRGLAVADACYFYGEGTCKFVPARAFLQPTLPAGYDFDGINAEVIQQRLKVTKGRLVLPDGMSYQYLVLPPQAGWTVNPPVLRKIKALVEAGATVIGPPPSHAPGLTGYPGQDKEIADLTLRLWGPDPVRGPNGRRKVGRGRVISGEPLEAVFETDRLQPDLEIKAGPPADLQWCHRRDRATDIFFLSNQSEQPVATEVVFRVSDRQPELFDPLTGQTKDLPAFTEQDGRTWVPLRFAPSQSWFVLFRHRPTPPPAENFPEPAYAGELTGPWTVQFDPHWGGPESVVFDKLEDWTTRPEEGIRFYSGTATYRKTFDLPAAGQGKRVLLDLGTLHDLAQVRLNGKALGVVWCPPWQIEITSVVVPKGNALEIDLVNLWVNRLIGDAGHPPGQRFTSTSIRTYDTGKHALSKSGLLGPVTFRVLDTQPHN